MNNPKVRRIRSILGQKLARLVAVDSGAYTGNDWNQRAHKDHGIVSDRAQTMLNEIDTIKDQLNLARAYLIEHSLTEEKG